MVSEEILSQEDVKMVKDALEQVKRAREELSRAKRAGLDVSDLEARLNEAESQLRKIHQVYIAPLRK